MEEQQIQDFVHRVSVDEGVRSMFVSDPLKGVMQEACSPRVMAILLRLVPYLAFDQPLVQPEQWWHA